MSELFVHQAEALEGEKGVPAESLRACLYFKTGAGKTRTGIELVKQAGLDHCLVITPPSTYTQWVMAGRALGVEVTPMSHAKFRMKGTKLSRHVAVIVDEFHMLGGHGKQGFLKMDTMARHLKAPLIIMSATPNYNDAERVYCIQHVLDPHSCKGGYLAFLYEHCNTVANRFSMTPDVDEDQPFKNYKDAAEYLAALPHVYYLPDDLVYTIEDIKVKEKTFPEMDEYGINTRSGRIIASGIEERHARVFLNLIHESGLLEAAPYQAVRHLFDPALNKPLLVFANHSTVAEALDATLADWGCRVACITGKTPAKKKAAYLDAFRDGVLDVLVGTASLATGTDGLDKVCDTLLILDDTDDPSLRRQLIGRIMPRGLDTDASGKKVYRIVLTP